jgi:5'-nucleotidase
MVTPSRPSPRRHRRLIASVALLAVAGSALAIGSGSASADRNDDRRPPKTVEVQLLAFNDYHGHLEAATPGTVPVVQNGATVLVPGGGAEFLASKLGELRAGHRNSLTVAAGDLVGGTPFFSGLFHDEPSVESLNAMGLDVSSVGNHEFDEGVTELLRLQNGGCHPEDGCYFPEAPFPGADFRWLAANVVDEATGASVLPPYWIKSFDGVKVGFIGMTLEDTPTLVAASGIVGYDFKDEVETANSLVPELTRRGAETIVVLLHEGGAQTVATVDSCEGISGPIVAINSGLDPEIDVMVTGHTHQPYNCVLPDPAGVPRRVTSAFSFGRVVSEINLVIDKRTGEVDRALSTATNHVVTQTGVKDPAQTAILAKWSPLSETVGNRIVGSITASITRARTNGAEDRGVQSSLGNTIADAQLAATTVNGAQLALMNPGGIRADLNFAQTTRNEGDGNVMYREAFDVQPFGNLLVTLPMTGDQLRRVLEQQCQPFRAAGQGRPILHLGVSAGFTYDLAWTVTSTVVPPPAGSPPGTPSTTIRNCTAVSATNMMLNGVPVDPAATYMVTTNNFLADGGDNFGVFREVPVPARIGGGDDLVALTDYLGLGNIAPAPVDRVRVTPTFITAP